MIYEKKHSEALEQCSPLLDKIWEELNTGYWKDVPIYWRQAYSLVSVIKALSLSALLSDSSRNIDHMTILRTCDMGLLMGAPILDNILARMSKEFQDAFGILAELKRESLVNPSESSDINRSNKKSKLDESYQDESTHQDREKKASKIPLPPIISSQKLKEIPRCSCPSVEMFQGLFMESGYPVVISDAIGYWPALTNRKWSLDYLRKVAGCRTVPVELGSRYTEESWTQKLMTISELIDKYIENPAEDVKGYLAQHQLFDQVGFLRSHSIE